ncbi:MAG: hypothetical protein KGJ23_09485 [Euryarchaeota archaeon]|nr:hypothetical protein [Euryarchaeota archaeon]MDE1836834.1 hypothetical protein [Euryarchaeota archaeon]MDE1882043.1 hypothetical protein [Euryarchaeota archaeon]MDE2044818.1 hypothetical protein [Thermoplasmata archaeon]
MIHRLAFRSPADEEYLALDLEVRRVFEEILPDILHRPFRSGLGYTIHGIRDHPLLWELKLNEFPPRRFRAIFDVDGEIVRFLGLGPRPGFYSRLRDKDRLPPSRF